VLIGIDPGLLPGWETIKSGEIQKKRTMTAEMLQGFYSSCIEPDPETGKAFAADAIISNPPAFAHIHIAEAMGLPLLMSFSELARDGQDYDCVLMHSDALEPDDRFQTSAGEYQGHECGKGPHQLLFFWPCRAIVS
jgi:hypothetical protein